MAIFIKHIIFFICLTYIMIIQQTLSVFIMKHEGKSYNVREIALELFSEEAKHKCYADISHIGSDIYKTSPEDSEKITLWLWPFDPGEIKIQKGENNITTVPFKASTDEKINWKIIVFEVPMCSLMWGCGNSSVDFEGFENVNNKHIQSITFEKSNETPVIIKSSKKLLWTDCQPIVSGTMFLEIFGTDYKKTTTISSEIANQTSNKTIMILSLMLANSFLVIIILGLYVWKLQKNNIKKDENLELSHMHIDGQENNVSRHDSDNSLYGVRIER
ncbi:unnamed protein product [Meganyctiphanes norvegica]|uniref:Uncharacterized protein n=1 Tax=Meganyctiphanes norvegica TaxID=48144 RepID=A0AAV2PN71_MEGNR